VDDNYFVLLVGCMVCSCVDAHRIHDALTKYLWSSRRGRGTNACGRYASRSSLEHGSIVLVWSTVNTDLFFVHRDFVSLLFPVNTMRVASLTVL
jgi:hypothetical protein